MWELRFVEHRDRKLKEMGKTLIGDDHEPQTQRVFDCVSHGGKTRRGVKRPGFKF